jgi:hypothetical protein
VIEIGPQRLGRVPSPPDTRDYRLENFLHLGAVGSTDSNAAALIALGVSELRKTTITYANWAARSYPNVTVTHWWKALDAFQRAQTLLTGVTPPPAGTVIWENPEENLNQGPFGVCVGDGFAQWGNTLPVDDKYTQTDARAIYYETTIIDGWPDDPDAPGGGQQGATVRSGAKAMQNRGRLSTYAFASSTSTVTQWIQQKGPVVIGVNWYSGMFSTDANGYIRITGGVEGGHCVILRGYLASEAAYLGENSWGPEWGQAGTFKLKVTDFGRLLSEDGEAVAAVELPL